MPTRPTVALAFATLVSAITLAESHVAEPTGTWSGKVEIEALRKHAPATGFVDDTESWKRLWSAWRPAETLPEVDFNDELVLVGTVSGPNLVMLQRTMDDQGAVKFTLGSTRMAGPGFGYKLVRISRKHVTSVNGNAVTDEMQTAEDSITVTVVGTLRAGVVAIGGETTGTTITAQGITWELELGESLAYRQSAAQLQGKRVLVRGNLERRRGVETKERWIVTVTELRAVDTAGLGSNSPVGLVATAKREDTRIRFLSERNATIVDIHSRFGIDIATITRASANWPKSIIVRLHLQGLESFRATAGETAVQWSVTSTGSHAKRVSLHTGEDEARLDETSPYYSELRIIGGNGKIPLQNGYFEVPLPMKLFEENPEAIRLRWIDFYRN